MILRPYQETGRDFLASRKVALLADEMRVGKTPQAILAAHAAGAERITVVCPAIAVAHWHREFQKWWPGEILPRVQVLSYNKATEVHNAGLRNNCDVFIPDECHFAKNSEAQRTKMVYGKDGFAWHAGATWALSGTPAPKHAGELWPMLKAFGATGMTYYQFTQRFCTWSWDQKITGTKVERIPELKAILKTVMLRRMRREVAPEMPDIDFQFLPVEPVSRADLKYITTAWSDERISEYVVGTWDTQDRVEVAKAKALPLVENIEFAIDNGLLKQTVVFGWHREPLLAVREALVARGITAELITGGSERRQREYVQDDFRDGKLQVVVAQIIAAGTAIDLSAASHGYFLELDWLSGNNLQAANRLISMDKIEKVTMDVVTWPGSADDRVQKVLLRRARELGQLY